MNILLKKKYYKNFDNLMKKIIYFPLIIENKTNLIYYMYYSNIILNIITGIFYSNSRTIFRNILLGTGYGLFFRPFFI